MWSLTGVDGKKQIRESLDRMSGLFLCVIDQAEYIKTNDLAK